jgi:hypothetical protein
MPSTDTEYLEKWGLLVTLEILLTRAPVIAIAACCGFRVNLKAGAVSSYKQGERSGE